MTEHILKPDAFGIGWGKHSVSSSKQENNLEAPRLNGQVDRSECDEEYQKCPGVWDRDGIQQCSGQYLLCEEAW